MGNTGEDIERLLKLQVLAVVGCSSDPARPSHRVSAYLMDAGYRVIPVNPAEEEILGERTYPDLASIPDPVDVVVVFRRSEAVPEAVRQAIAAGAKGVWMQKGIVHAEAAALARDSGLTVVMDECFMTQHLSRMGR